MPGAAATVYLAWIPSAPECLWSVSLCVQTPPRQAPPTAYLHAHTGPPTMVALLLQPTMGQLQG